MNQELLDFIYDILQQLIAGIPIGTILSLVVYYALNKVKAKTAEFPAKAQDLENQVKTFADKVVAVSTELRNNVVSVVNAELDKFSKKADEYQLVIDGYHKQLEEAEKQNRALIAQNEITLDILKIYVSENKNAVVSGIAKSVNEKLVNYKEHIYLAQDIINVAPEIKEKVIFIAENYPSALITKMVDLPVEVLEEMMEKYEKEKPQG